MNSLVGMISYYDAKKRVEKLMWMHIYESKDFFIPMSSYVLYVHKGNLIIRPSQEKLEMSQSHFQNQCKVIFGVQNTHHVDHFMVLIDASTRWSHICLLSTRNQGFVKLLVQLRAHFPDYPIKKIVLIILVKLRLMLFMSIVYQLELKLSIH